MNFLIGIVIGLSFVCASVRSQTTCIKCDSKNENEKDCGFIKNSENGLSIATCDSVSDFGCISQIYYSNASDNAYPGWYTQRGCALSSDDCTDGLCSLCSGNNCNAEVFPTDRHKCLKCVDSDCNPAKSEYCSVYLEGSQDCVTLYNEEGSVLVKSCYADIPDSTRELCDNENYLDCKKCSGENCNVHTQREGTKCHQCTGVDCLVINGLSNLVDCMSSCYIGMNSNGEPVRGCSSDFISNAHLCSNKETSTNECFICEGDGCNSIVYPITKRLHCHTCSNGDCEPTDENLEYCARYHEDERCASVFKEGSIEVIARGCVSTLETSEKQICESNSTNCLKCAYDKCNKDDSNLKTDFCIECNSEDDASCSNANSIKEKRCSSNLCYTRLREREDKYFGQHLERGCLADLLQVTTCDGTDCLQCTGRNCNNKVFPENRTSCISCQGESCKDEPVDKICNKFVTNESCLTFYGSQNEVILRECYSEAKNLTREVCDDTTNLQCTKCEGNLCNNDSQRRGNKCFKCQGLECMNPNIGNEVDCMSECYVGLNSNGEAVRDCASAFNSTNCENADMNCLKCDGDHCNAIVYPTQDRLTCVKCLNEDCETLNTRTEYCERLHLNERCVTVFDSTNNSVIERGCSSTIQNSLICDSNSPNCLKCNFDECNIETSVNEKYHCVSCHSSDDPKCVSSPNATQVSGCTTNQCVTRLLPSSGTGQHIVRGCVQVSPEYPGLLCTGERCNSISSYPTNRLSCYHCSGDLCGSGHLTEKICTIYNSQNMNCLTVYGTENEVTYRDCYVDAVKGTRDLCDVTNDLTCTKCSGKLCNNDVKRRGLRCIKCEGIDCFKSGDISNSIDCLSGGCYVGLNANGELKRDCASAVTTSSSCVSNDTQAGNCLVCQDDYCNSVAYPTSNRLICNECLGDSCENPTWDEKYCERLHQDESCVSVFNSSDVIIERGCSSTVQNSVVCNSTDTNCLKCNVDRCNVQNSKQEIYNCVSCNSQDDPGCVTNTASPSIKTCRSNQCYSRLVPNTESIWQHVEKGCVADLPNPSACTGSSCTACVGDRCNNILYPSDRMTCLNCRNNDCSRTNVSSTACTLFNRLQQGCVSLYNSDNEVFYRGCYSDAAKGTQDICDDPSQLLCTKCTSRNCNEDSIRRGKKCYKCQGLECFEPNHPADVVDCISNCYMGINEKGESVRDCASVFTNTSACGVDDNGINRCSVCSDDHCNGVQFPIVNRLQCQICSGESCGDFADNLDYCQRYGGQERCVTVFSNDGNVIERGCSSELVNHRYCDQNYANCIQCGTSGCNTINSKLSRMCVTCNSTVNAACVTNPSSLSTSICEKGCYTRLVNGSLTRGCYEQLGENYNCVLDNDCKFCNNNDKCNIEKYPDDRKSCQTCIGNANCEHPVSQLCIKYKANDLCVTVFSGYVVSRKGCLSDQPAGNQAVCGISTSPLCTTCSSRNNCNIETVRKDENCVVCSSALDPNCSQRPSMLTSEHCSVPSDGQCYSRIQGGATVRGCKDILTSSEVEQCRNTTVSSQCTTTEGPGSNNRIIPQNRRRCHHCDSRVDATCSGKPTNASSTLPCKRYSQPESCLKLELNGAVVRGCVADFSADICSQGECHSCNNEDGCNESSVKKFNIVCLLLSLILLFASTFKSS